MTALKKAKPIFTLAYGYEESGNKTQKEKTIFPDKGICYDSQWGEKKNHNKNESNNTKPFQRANMQSRRLPKNGAIRRNGVVESFVYTCDGMVWCCFANRYFHASRLDTVDNVFLSVDPASPDVQAPLSLNPYQFAYNNPLNLTDSTGMFVDAMFQAAVGEQFNALGSMFDELGQTIGNIGESSMNFISGNGFNTNLDVSKSNELSLVFKGHKQKGKGNYVEGHVKIVDGHGAVQQSWKANSGSKTPKPIPSGIFPIGNIRANRTDPDVQKSMLGKSGKVWSVDINNVPGRTEMRIHPDGGYQGTAGCIGIIENDLSLLRAIQSYSFNTISVH